MLIANMQHLLVRLGNLLSPRLLVANVGSLALSLATIKVLALILPIASFAAYVLIITFQSFSTLCLTGPLRVGLTRYHASTLATGSDADYRRFAFSTFAASALVTPIFAGIVFYSIGFETGVTIYGVTLAVLYGILSDYAAFLSSAALQCGRTWLGVWLILAGKLALLLGAVLSNSIYDVIGPENILLYATLIFVSALFFLRNYSVGQYSLATLFVDLKWAERAPEIVRFGWIFVATGIISWAQMSMPRYYLSWWQTQEDIVRFYLVTQIALLSMVTITSVVGQTISPILFRRHDDKQLIPPSPWAYEMIGGVVVIFVVALIAALLSFTFGDWLVALVSNKGINGISLLLAISFATYGIYAIAQVLRIYGDQIKRPQIYLSVNIAYPLAAVLFSFIAVRYSLTYLCLALLASEMLHLILIASINHKEHISLRPNA